MKTCESLYYLFKLCKLNKKDKPTGREKQCSVCVCQGRVSAKPSSSLVLCACIVFLRELCEVEEEGSCELQL